ncbi:uncharacterized protein DUF4129 [Krasilnikovia cinnamomea]|uniref:Uncharacterized protein DUF4129 n=1 Tax=Krasilnikovia cinnamomea TaxID=349313 RepID=A0A4Q7ZMA1_9ACTN|nr:DUF4129 domain-containing protein [Krasilnikovia cinnamomea]RZU52118.1 uncharacterized protein DUF4129 [Krasilnikovia cinnamomea]
MDLAALRRWWPVAAVLGLLFLAALAATRSAPQLERITPEEAVATTAAPLLPPSEPTPGPSGAEATPSSAPTPEAASGLPDWVGTAAVAVLVVTGLIVLALIVWALVRDQARRRARRGGRRVTRQAEPGSAEDIVAVLDAGLDELSDADRDPRRAVIACWVRLEQAAAAAGTPRHPGDTPTDLIARLLAEQHVDAQVLAAFAAVYREARYATTHTVDERMRGQARTALQQLRADLGAEVAAR